MKSLEAKEKSDIKKITIFFGIVIIPWIIFVFWYVLPWINSWPLVHPSTTQEEFERYAIGIIIIVPMGIFLPLVLLIRLSNFLLGRWGLEKPQKKVRKV